MQSSWRALSCLLSISVPGLGTVPLPDAQDWLNVHRRIEESKMLKFPDA